MSSLLKSFLDYLFPPHCFYCTNKLELGFLTLCKSCQEDLQLLRHQQRCGFCFQVMEGKMCLHCRGQARFCDYKAACFDTTPIVSFLIQRMKQDSPFLVSSMASFLLLQFQDLDWPIPDYITYVPDYLTRPYIPLTCPTRTLAQALGKLLQTPVLHALYKTKPALRQENLPLSERLQLAVDTFSIYPATSTLAQKNILIIDDCMVTGKTLESCAYALLEKHAKRIYGLTIGISDLS